MSELTISQQLENNPWLKDMAKYTLFIPEESFRTLNNGPKISIDNEEISIELLQNILTNDEYYTYVYKFFNNEISNFSIAYIIQGDTGKKIYLKKTQIIKGFDLLISRNIITLEKKSRQRYEELKAKVSFNNFFKKIRNEKYQIIIDGNEYFFSVEQLVSFMQLPEDRFNKLCEDDDITTIYGYTKEHFIYAAYNYFAKNNLFDEFLIPPDIIKKFNDLSSMQKVDLQAINTYTKTTDTLHEKVEISRELESLILSGMPEDASSLEKAIYIYIKMCKVLTYDEEYYVTNQKGNVVKKHKDINYISRITPKNNAIVCFEFNMIYSKLLNKLGINFKSDYKEMVGEAYGQTHANLIFRAQKFLISADAVTTILQGDLMQAKLNQPLLGLKCINKNARTQQEFKAAVSKMYWLIAEQERDNNLNILVEHKQTLEELLKEYSKITTNRKDIDLGERLSILISKVSSKKMIGIDTLSYILQLKKVLFTLAEREINIKISIIRNNHPFDPRKEATASVVFSVNTQGFSKSPELTTYYHFIPGESLTNISREELQNNFNNRIFEYIEKDDPRIPGINEEGVMKL